MSIQLPKILLNNMDYWSYDDDGMMVASKDSSNEVKRAVADLNKEEIKSQVGFSIKNL